MNERYDAELSMFAYLKFEFDCGRNDIKKVIVKWPLSIR